MEHDAEGDAARYLAGAMSVQHREAFSHHLLACAECWREVDLGRRGRSHAESARTVAPADLRDRIRALVEAEPAVPQRNGRRWGRLVPYAVPVAAAAALALVVSLGTGTVEPPSLRQAVADYTAEQLPGSQLPDERAPDLSALRLEPVGAGGGAYGDLEVDGFAYRDPAGRRVVLYLSDEPFPEAPGADLLDGADGAWVVDRGDVVVLCARLPHAMLVVGQDRALVRSAASALGVL